MAERWGELVAYADARGRLRPVNDSGIAACCLTYGLPLATLNAADFADFAEFEGLELLLSQGRCWRSSCGVSDGTRRCPESPSRASVVSAC